MTPLKHEPLTTVQSASVRHTRSPCGTFAHAVSAASHDGGTAAQPVCCGTTGSFGRRPHTCCFSMNAGGAPSGQRVGSHAASVHGLFVQFLWRR